MPDLTTKEALLERMVAATEDLATKVPEKFDKYLPLAGGTMTGAIKGNPITLTADDGNGNTSDLVLNPNGSATIDEKNVMTNQNEGTGVRQLVAECSNAHGTFKLSVSAGTFMACIVAFGSGTSRAYNRIFFVNSCWTGGPTRTKYYTVPCDEADTGNYTVTVDNDSPAVSFTTTSNANINAYVTILAEHPTNPVKFTFTPAQES